MAALHRRRSDRLLRLLSLPKPDPNSSPSSFELDESDIFSAPIDPFLPNPNPNSNPHRNPNNPNPNPISSSSPMAVPRTMRPLGERKILRQSAPVSVPMARRIGYDDDVDDDDDDDVEEEEGVPPHVMMARMAGKESPADKFSVVVGAGRTLKGRDLRRVRNAVFLNTGFLD